MFVKPVVNGSSRESVLERLGLKGDCVPDGAQALVIAVMAVRFRILSLWNPPRHGSQALGLAPEGASWSQCSRRLYI